MISADKNRRIEALLKAKRHIPPQKAQEVYAWKGEIRCPEALLKAKRHIPPQKAQKVYAWKGKNRCPEALSKAKRHILFPEKIKSIGVFDTEHSLVMSQDAIRRMKSPFQTIL